MRPIGKTTSTNSSSEIIGSAESDSKSSDSTESSYGLGDEGASKSTNNIAQNKTTNTAKPEQHLLSCSIKLLIGLSCPLVAVSSAVSMIYFGNQLNNPNNGSRNADSAAFAAGAVMTAIGLLGSYLIHSKPSHPSPQVPNA